MSKIFNSVQSYGYFPKFKMAIAIILLLQNDDLANLCFTECHSSSAYQIWWKFLIHGVEMALGWNPRRQRPPSWILDRWHFWSHDPNHYVILYKFTKLEPNPSSVDEVMAIFPKSKMAFAATLILQKWWFWPRFLLHSIILHQHTKFDENPPIRSVEIALWWNPKWRPPPSWILIRWQFWSRDPIQGVILNNIWAKSLIPGRSYGYFSKIEDGGRPPFWNFVDVN